MARDEGAGTPVVEADQVVPAALWIRLDGSIEERDETYDVLSPNSPLGQAILGATPGTSVTYQGPRRELSVTVVGVRPRG